MYDVIISHPLPAGMLANTPREPNPLPLLNAAWASKVPRFRSFVQQAGLRCSLLPVPISALGGWHREAHWAILSIASGIASRAVVEFSRARSILFRRHVALHVTRNGACLLSGCVENAYNSDVALERVLLSTIGGRTPLCGVITLFFRSTLPSFQLKNSKHCGCDNYKGAACICESSQRGTFTSLLC